MRIHQMLVNELLTQAEFRSAFLEYARERVGEASLLPVSEWPFPDAEAPVPAPVPVATGWRAMTARETIQEGDQWAPLSDPERWRPVGDSVGKQVGQFKKSRFRCDAAREVVEGPELLDPVALGTHRNLNPPDGFALLPAGEVTRRGDWWRSFDHNGIIIHDEPVAGLVGEVVGEDSRWVFFRPIPVAPLPEADDWLAEPPSALFPTVPTHVGATPPPEPVAPSDAERRRSWRLLEPHEVAMPGDRYAGPSHTEFVESYLGHTAADIRTDFGITYPIIRPIVRSRDGYTAHDGMRIMDPTETVPLGHLRFTRRHNGIDFGDPITGDRVGDSIIFTNIVEVENA